MQQFYSKLVRKSYRTLRHPRIRKVNWLNRIVLKLFKRDLWRPCMKTVALGLSMGLFCSMLPIPMQMILAAICCLIFRANIPISLAACWVSNPFTQIPLWFCQEKLGSFIRDSLNFGWLDFLSMQGSIPFVEMEVNLANFAVGVGVSAISLALLAFPAVWLFYALVPKKYLQHSTAKSCKKIDSTPENSQS